MTFSKHNWNQLSESSKRELKRQQAYQQGYQDALNEQMGVGGGMGMSTTAPKMPPSGGGMPGRSNAAGGAMAGQSPGGRKDDFHPALRPYLKPRRPGLGYGYIVPPPGVDYDLWRMELIKEYEMNL